MPCRPFCLTWQERESDRKKLEYLTEENARLEFEKKSSLNESASLETELSVAMSRMNSELSWNLYCCLVCKISLLLHTNIIISVSVSSQGTHKENLNTIHKSHTSLLKIVCIDLNHTCYQYSVFCGSSPNLDICPRQQLFAFPTISGFLICSQVLLVFSPCLRWLGIWRTT